MARKTRTKADLRRSGKQPVLKARVKPSGGAGKRRPGQPFSQRLRTAVKRPDAPAAQRVAIGLKCPEVPGHLATTRQLQALAPTKPRKSL